MAKEEITQNSVIIDYFLKHPNRDIPHPEIVDCVTEEYKRLTGKVLRDPDRAIRKLSQEGFLIKVAKGVYRYDPEYVHNPELEDFSESVKEQVKARDGYKCVICGLGPENGVELQVDHILPKDKGGKATLENGQTLCAKHNFRKKNYGQTEMCKKLFVTMYNTAKKTGDSDTMDFCADVLEVFEKHNMDDHIIWKR